MYWFIRKVLVLICLRLGQQCPGKRKSGYALECCSLRAFHEGVCISHEGQEF